MIVDSSALIAILSGEPDAPFFVAALDRPDPITIAAPTLLEASIVAKAPRHEALDSLLRKVGAEATAFTREHALLAREVYGKGSGSPAQLTFGDCISYALAKATGEPLLFKGDDFRHTDIESAVESRFKLEPI